MKPNGRNIVAQPHIHAQAICCQGVDHFAVKQRPEQNKRAHRLQPLLRVFAEGGQIGGAYQNVRVHVRPRIARLFAQAAFQPHGKHSVVGIGPLAQGVDIVGLHDGMLPCGLSPPAPSPKRKGGA